jgi:hypothetical protein
MHRESRREKQRQFTCEKPEDVVQFLEENQQVPGLYAFTPPRDPNLPASSRRWDANAKDVLLRPTERFPALPPPPDDPLYRPRPLAGTFDKTALDWDSPLGDGVDAFAAAHAWYCYAQEPLPAPDDLPGISKPIIDRARQRRPRNMTTLIFRNYPAQGRRYMAERLQQEGWYDDDPDDDGSTQGYDLRAWFPKEVEVKGQPVALWPVQVGGGRKWSLEAWQKAADAWKKHGEDNHLLLTPLEEENLKQQAEPFWKRYGMQPNARPPELREEDLPPEERKGYHAARYLFEWSFYTGVSNFNHHYHRTQVEATEATVRARKLFYKADSLELVGSPGPALDLYQQPRERPWADGRRHSPLEAWRELVLLPHKDFRRDSFVQETTAEIQIRYLQLYDRRDGRVRKEQLGAALVAWAPSLNRHPAARVLAVALPRWSDVFPRPVVPGPFDVKDAEGVPLVDRRSLETVLDRMNLLPRRPPPTGATPTRVIKPPGS